jgi:hypothetical protein
MGRLRTFNSGRALTETPIRTQPPATEVLETRAFGGRSSRLILLAILAVGLIRGLYWVAMTEVPGPIDEAAHLAYIESIATGDGIPVVGEDKPSANILKLLRYTTTGPGRYFPLDPESPEGWGASGEQYEAIQPPLYYLVMALPFKLAGSSGIVAALYTVRVLSLLVALAAVPLTWLLARELFPRQPVIAPLSAAVLVAVNGYNSSLSSVTNDALVMPLSVAALWLVVRGWHRQTIPAAVACGIAMGLSVLSKSNAAALLLMVPLALVIFPRPREEGRTLLQGIRWVAITAVVAGLTLVPWLAWNFSAYGTISGGGEITSELLSSLVPVYDLSLGGIRSHLVNATSAFWQFRTATEPSVYGKVLFAAAGISLVAGLVGSFRSRRHTEARSLVFLALVGPVVFVFMALVVYTAYTGSIVGRHMFPAMVPAIVMMVAGAILALGTRFGSFALCALVLVALFLERGENRTFIDAVYLRNIVEEGVAPVVDQNLNTAWVNTNLLRVNSPCPVRYLGVAFEKGEPALAVLLIPGQEEPAVAVRILPPVNGVTTFQLKPPYPKDFVAAFPDAVNVASAPGGARSVGFFDPAADRARAPMAQLHCRTGDWRQARFSQLYDQNHPQISYRQAVRWADLWAWGALGLSILAGAGMGAAHLRRRRPRAG